MNETDVNNTSQSEEVKEETQVEEPQVETPKSGDKTDPNLLLKSLQEEREKRRLMEEELLALKAVHSEPSYQSDDERIAKLEDQIRLLTDKEQLANIKAQFPELKDFPEFDEYRKEFPQTKMENVAKLFLSEKGLIGTPRKGLEKTTGGSKQPQQTGMSVADVKLLRETNFKKYQKMLMEGKLKVNG